MNTQKNISALMLLISLTSCYIGPGGICGPQTPILYCQSKEDRDKILHPKAYIEYWEKVGMTGKERLTDWLACGGQPNGNFSLDRAKRLPGEGDDDFRTRLEHDFERCMLRSGYRYTGNCSSAYMKSQPLCGAQ